MGAEELVTRIQSYFDKEKQEDGVVQEDPEDSIIEEIPEVTKAPVYTGTISTGSSVELDYVLSESPQTTGSQSSGTVVPTTQTTTTTTTTTSQPTTTKPKTTTTSSKKSLSRQDEADMKAFLNAIVQ